MRANLPGLVQRPSARHCSPPSFKRRHDPLSRPTHAHDSQMAPFTKHNANFFLLPFLCAVAWLLLFLVTLSAPIAKSIYLAQVNINLDINTSKDAGPFHIPGVSVATVQESLRFGVFGYCSSGVHADELGVFSQDQPAECSPKHLGYKFDSEVLKILHLDKVAGDVSGVIRTGLSMHVVGESGTIHRRSSTLTAPAATVFAFVTLLLSLAAPWVSHWLYDVVTAICASLASFFAMVAFAFAAAFANSANKILGAVDSLSVKKGNGVWMDLVAWLLLFLVSVVTVRVWWQKRKDNNARRASSDGPLMRQTSKV
ncbi:hypothetical protein EXIGLDRAFT_288878 [Exidia glandulosa HHB12029]|uniref:Pali-domain-containing protein n=1 Tax=Exidia glandulosa HHB12029 TaxID=1314781 RepID=A0A165DF66_EXIGL|nr:hypothetical protein EXIGLDRAFT_288878 [Exidia glandulosa HHB12029]